MSAHDNLGPQFYYHGTNSESAESIQKTGLHPGANGMWHVASDERVAGYYANDAANDRDPVVLRIDLSGHPHSSARDIPGYVRGKIPVPPERITRAADPEPRRRRLR